ncbi:hypothetical protein [Leucothrix arctica]|uniref:Uncharacterized protein n=1 Tax=Leucothrix arctica TaxID=1481894 RepID=A0A317C6Y7_9GAMM|nr:hypothetical protein [Leucothrix arctica]PWQ93981.1 hypothetical protein DKT75_20520 [Leucothrix arctica]
MKKLLLLTLLTSCAYAAKIDVETFKTSLDYAQVTKVEATQSANGNWCFNTTVRHNDEGWEHYADGWEVLDMNGNQLGYRMLAHPHENEQPFTRSLCGVVIPEAMTQVMVRAKCEDHGYGGKAIVVMLKQ